MRMQVFIVNLDRYKEDQIRGSWFEPPIDLEEMKERIGLDGEYKEYAIFDYDLPFEIDESTPVSEINRLCGMVQEMEGSPLYDALPEVQKHWFNSLEELLENQYKILYYPDCTDLIDIAKFWMEESGITRLFAEVPFNLEDYIDYQAIGRDFEIHGNFLVTANGIFEYLK
ncbi:antirestriction protein ArdA [Oceanobacillus oncorhynchi subsp. incaldanensis]|uniref:Antirestriction protein (ArdA) n=3 Tax=Oceanobacillus TaxID=182709 RepID=A0A0A1MTG3_9BACI|nr:MULTISPECIES: antirestriction protein ArdA [Bacillaceae]MDM8100620.1 antirestriction protein ArdA [Oceanobacillus oncorhynchi]GIO17582.1 antirestriction protein ArdA [Oceanobacillus oncorhynchi subsp. incaldanensis]CEI82964.1 Antirestriction protein (ArdA) [Oceanobacillus oncorhynchi]